MIAVHKVTSKERDSESGLDNFGARYNTASTSKFTRAQPIQRRKARGGGDFDVKFTLS